VTSELSGASAWQAKPLSIDVVVCTYDNASSLDRTLGALAAQRDEEGVDWAVTVVDNNCTDDTPAVCARHGVRVVHEPIQGLTPARASGVRATAREWVAFVDDDCLVAPDWIARAAAAAAEHPRAGAIGGRVIVEWQGGTPRHAARYEWAYAAQDHGPTPRRVPFLVGAGLVMRRAAIADTGWLERQLLADRVGRRLVSGGDVEIALRLAARHELWFDPRLTLRHAIDARRGEPRHLARLVRGLGTSQLFGDTLTWEGGYARWVPRSLRNALPYGRDALRAARTGRKADAGLSLCFLAGYLTGVLRLALAGRARRRELLGAAGSLSPRPQ
jgi:glycosyltransferase involved in cell wall biosynthesis